MLTTAARYPAIIALATWPMVSSAGKNRELCSATGVPLPVNSMTAGTLRL
jgi:hypothetical protein